MIPEHARSSSSVEQRNHAVVRAVRDLVARLVREDRPGPDDPDGTADELFLLLEGSVAHRGIEQGDALQVRARERAERLLGG